MAKIDLGEGIKPPFIGTIQNLCIYEMYGRYYIRLKSSLTGKRVKKDPAFRNTMRHAAILAEASRMAATVYRALPKEQKEHILYRKLTGMAIRMLKEGASQTVIVAALQSACRKPEKKTVVLAEQNNSSYIQHKVYLDMPGILSVNQEGRLENTLIVPVEIVLLE
ncbi:MAG TPA: hypothetical protein VM802_11410 [Chitinophaga sp.]|uniref:hypothetical protein n=1 Tax=Chitinophaga sp. TaxID=1869181 RepID=UPI002BD441B2|nr:hypothetical protein [Chitinophaga sp.]HVI45473.1 hypothetical protein [Chitinophaga sp.]